MKAGRELDALVAEKVMGWKVNRTESGRHWHTVEVRPRRQIGADCCETKYVGGSFMPSRRIEDAWEVVEKMKADGWAWHIGGQYARSEKPWCSYRAPEDSDNVITVSADTAPLAICLAALRACGVEVDE